MLGRLLPRIALAEEALRIRRLNTGDNSFETGKSWLNLGFYYTRKGQYDKGIQYFKEAANIFEQLPGATMASFNVLQFRGVLFGPGTIRGRF